MTANTTLIKEMNKKLVREQLKHMRKAAIIELAHATGLSVVTVKSLLIELIEQGEVREGEAVPSNGGRPSMLYIYNNNYRHALVIYGYQKNNDNLINFCVVNLFGECVYRNEVYIEDVQVDSFAPYIDKAMDMYPTIGTIGFGLPGVEYAGIITLNDYCGIVGDAFMNYYQRKYALPVIFVNDVNAAVKGFSSDKTITDISCLVGIYFPRIYPPGAGMMINGDIYTGAHHFAGEIGHLLPGVDWRRIHYDDKEAVADAVASILAIYCRVVAPNQFILYGDFFSDTLLKKVQLQLSGLLNERYIVNAAFSADFETDFERGMIMSALEQLIDTL